MTYTIPEIKRNEVLKTIASLKKKAAKYGMDFTAELGEPYATEIAIYETDYVDHCEHKVGTQMVEAFDLTVEGDKIKKDGYEVVAQIEHLDGGNIVNVYKGEIDMRWTEAKCICEHCNSDRFRKITYIVKSENDEKQVGSTCLKDYCGIDPRSIGWRNELHDVLLNDFDVSSYRSQYSIPTAYDSIEVLALAIRAAKKGYVPSGENGSNKSQIEEAITEGATDEEMKAARKMADEILSIDKDDRIAFLLSDSFAILASGYCASRHFGYLAYTPIAFEKYQDELKRRAELEAEIEAQKASEYIGQVGERMTFDIQSMRLVTHWSKPITYYTEATTYLYKFITTDGNVLVWFASKMISDGVKKLTATVKDHTERDGVKQTIITRAKTA